MPYITILRNKLHGQNNKGSGPQGKYMAGDMVDDTMEPVEQLDRWLASGVAEMSGDVEREEAVKRGQNAIAEQNMVAQKAKAERTMEVFDALPKKTRDAANYHGDEVIEEELVKPVKRKPGRPRKNETPT